MGIKFKPASPEELAERGVLADQPVEQAPVAESKEQPQADAEQPAEKPARKSKKAAA